MIQLKTDVSTRHRSRARTSDLRVLASVYCLLLTLLTAATAYGAVSVRAVPTVSPDGQSVEWTFGQFVYENTTTLTCEPTCRAPSSLEWDIDDGSQRLVAERDVSDVCWADETDHVQAAQRLVRSVPRIGRRVASGHEPRSNISGTLVSCDGRKYTYLSNSNHSPPVFPLSCTITAPISLSYEIENGTQTKNAGAAVTCKGSGRASATVSVWGESSVQPVPGLDVSTEVVSTKIDVQAGHSSPIDITVTVTALNPEPGKYHATFVYVLDII